MTTIYQEIPLLDLPRQSFRTTLGDQEVGLSIWWQPNGESWFATLESPLGEPVLAGRRIVLDGSITDGVLTPTFKGRIVCQAMTPAREEPKRDAWAGTHRLIYVLRPDTPVQHGQAAQYLVIDLTPPRNLHVENVVEDPSDSSMVIIRWDWEAPAHLGPGATSVSYEAEVRSITGGVAGSWSAATGYVSPVLTYSETVAESDTEYQIRVRAVNNAAPPMTSDWVTSNAVATRARAGGRYFGPAFGPEFE